MTREQDGKMNAAHQEWGRLKTIEIEREIENARQTWDGDLAKIIEQTQQEAVEKAQSEWLKEKEGEVEMSNAKEDDLSEALKTAKQEWERDKVI
jgi:hypothetical protein